MNIVAVCQPTLANFLDGPERNIIEFQLPKEKAIWQENFKIRMESGVTVANGSDAPAASLKTLDALENAAVTPQKQPAESTTAYAAMLNKKMGEIDWSQSAVQIERLVRGLNPWPSAYTHLAGKTLKIWKAAVRPSREQKKEPGSVILEDKKHFGIQTGDGVLEIL